MYDAHVWPFKKREQTRAGSWSIADPAMAAYFGYNPGDVADVTERSALGLSAFWRAGSLISGTIATLPLGSYRVQDDQTTPVATWLDDPGKACDMTPFEWKEAVVWYLFLGGDAFLYHLFNGAGAIVGAQPIHPRAVTVEWDMDRIGRKKYSIITEDGRVLNGPDGRGLDARHITQVMGPSLDGLRGMSVLTIGRTSLGGAIAGDKAALKMFQNGGMITAIASPDEEFEEGDADTIKADLDLKFAGPENSGGIAVVNRRIKVTPWSMTAADQEFLDQRKFGIEEVSRWTGVPPHLLMQTDKQTSWGTGVAEQNLGLRQYNLMGYTSRIESKLNRLTPGGQVSRFDFKELERPSPKDEADLAIKKWQGGVVTLNEARTMMGLPKVADGDRYYEKPGAPVATEVQ